MVRGVAGQLRYLVGQVCKVHSKLTIFSIHDHFMGKIHHHKLRGIYTAHHSWKTRAKEKQKRGQVRTRNIRLRHQVKDEGPISRKGLSLQAGRIEWEGG